MSKLHLGAVELDAMELGAVSARHAFDCMAGFARCDVCRASASPRQLAEWAVALVAECRRQADMLHRGVAIHDELIKRVDAAEAEVARFKAEHLGACELVARMHNAAMGETTGPVVGVVEDVANLHTERNHYRGRVDDLVDALKTALSMLGVREKSFVDFEVGMYESCLAALRTEDFAALSPPAPLPPDPLLRELGQVLEDCGATLTIAAPAVQHAPFCHPAPEGPSRCICGAVDPREPALSSPAPAADSRCATCGGTGRAGSRCENCCHDCGWSDRGGPDCDEHESDGPPAPAAEGGR